MKNLPTFDEFLNESKIDIHSDIIDSRGKYDRTDENNEDINHICDIVKELCADNDITIKEIELISRNKFDGYELLFYIPNALRIEVKFGKVGLEDHREGYITIRYGSKEERINKTSRRFGDVSINPKDPKESYNIHRAIEKLIT